MNINQSQLIELIHQGEGLMMEFKKCRNQLNKDVYETVCAFLNRHGGTLLLGVNDNGDVMGIDPDAIAQIKKDFVTAINNAQKINPPAYLSVEDVEIDEKIILRIYVPESSQVHRCNGRIYDRNEDGDFDITDHTRQVADLYHRKTATYSENKLYPHAGLSDLRIDLIARCRKIATLRQKDHPWGDMDDLELLKSAQLFQTDPETGKEKRRNETYLVAADSTDAASVITKEYFKGIMEDYEISGISRSNVIEYITTDTTDPTQLVKVLKASLKGKKDEYDEILDEE